MPRPIRRSFPQNGSAITRMEIDPEFHALTTYFAVSETLQVLATLFLQAVSRKIGENCPGSDWRYIHRNDSDHGGLHSDESSLEIPHSHLTPGNQTLTPPILLCLFFTMQSLQTDPYRPMKNITIVPIEEMAKLFKKFSNETERRAEAEKLKIAAIAPEKLASNASTALLRPATAFNQTAQAEQSIDLFTPFYLNFMRGFIVNKVEQSIVFMGMSKENATRLINAAMAISTLVAAALSAELTLPLFALTVALALASETPCKNLVRSGLMAYTFMSAANEKGMEGMLAPAAAMVGGFVGGTVADLTFSPGK